MPVVTLPHSVSGLTNLYAVVIAPNTDQWWNGATLETFSAGNYTNYDVPLSEYGTTMIYKATVPALPVGTYNVIVKQQAGGSPAESDAIVGYGSIDYWDGSLISIAASVWAYIVEGAFSMLQIMRGIASFCMGKASGGGTANPKTRDLSDSKDRISMTVDSNGNRTAVVRDLT